MTPEEFQALVGRVIQQESGGNPNAVSPVGAQGLMQVMPDTARSPGFGVAPLQDPFDPAQNRAFGEQYLSAMLDRYSGDQERALAAYNWGPGNADKWSGNRADLPAETRGYLENILGGTQFSTRGPDTPQAVAQDTRAALGLLNNGGGQMTPEQKPQGLLGALGIQKRDPSAGGETAKPFYQRERFGDVLANLAPALGRMGVMGLEGPAQAALDARRSRQGQAAQVNKTREWLLSQPGGEKFAGMIEAAGPQAALQAYMQAQQGPEQTSAMQNYQYLIAQGVSPQEAMASAFGGGGSTVNVNTAPALDTRPITAAPAKDYQRVWDEQSGTYRDIVIPGTDTARQLEQAGAAGATGADQTANTSGIVLGNIDAVRDKINSSALPVTGAGGAVLSKIPGTNAYDVGALISTLNSNIAFDRLQAMRDASPTGGALGAVSAPELELLRSSIGSLDQAQSEEQFIRALDIVEQQYKKLMEKAEAYPNASAFGFGSGGSGGGSGLSEEDMRYLNGGN